VNAAPNPGPTSGHSQHPVLALVPCDFTPNRTALAMGFTIDQGMSCLNAVSKALLI